MLYGIEGGGMHTIYMTFSMGVCSLHVTSKTIEGVDMVWKHEKGNEKEEGEEGMGGKNRNKSASPIFFVRLREQRSGENGLLRCVCPPEWLEA